MVDIHKYRPSIFTPYTHFTSLPTPNCQHVFFLLLYYIYIFNIYIYLFFLRPFQPASVPPFGPGGGLGDVSGPRLPGRELAVSEAGEAPGASASREGEAAQPGGMSPQDPGKTPCESWVCLKIGFDPPKVWWLEGRLDMAMGQKLVDFSDHPNPTIDKNGGHLPQPGVLLVLTHSHIGFLYNQAIGLSLDKPRTRQGMP